MYVLDKGGIIEFNGGLLIYIALLRDGQKDKQRSTKHTHKTKYRVTLTSRQTVVNSLRTLEDTKEVAKCCYVIVQCFFYIFFAFPNGFIN
jgi:hypothetical protein